MNDEADGTLARGGVMRATADARRSGRAARATCDARGHEPPVHGGEMDAEARADVDDEPETP